MNGVEMLRLIDSIARDRNLDKELLYSDIEQAMVSAARKHFNADDTEGFTAEVDRVSGAIRVFRGEEEIPLEMLGRIPAQTAKQVMIQRFREDERESIYNEFIDRVGELTSGIAQRYEGGALVVQIGRAEGFMPRSEQIPGEQHQPGERVRCLILDVRESGNQVKIVLSRAAPEVVRRLFEIEVPEVSERIIEIKAMAREAGHRTKIAVSSIDAKVDAVGACVGVRGSRIKNIVDELGGEKIDIVRWNESSQILIQNALKPAEIVETSLCFELGRATVVVNEDQLSLAIGKRGQNVRLAARLTQWDVDILTPAEFTKSLDILEQTLTTIEAFTEEHVDRLAALGVISVFDVEEVGVEYVMETLGCDQETAQHLVTICGEKGKEVAEQQQKEKEEAERQKAEAAKAQAEGVAADHVSDILGEGPATRPGVGESEPVAGDFSGGIVEMLQARREAAKGNDSAQQEIVSEGEGEGEGEGEPAYETDAERSAHDEAPVGNTRDEATAHDFQDAEEEDAAEEQDNIKNEFEEIDAHTESDAGVYADDESQARESTGTEKTGE